MSLYHKIRWLANENLLLSRNVGTFTHSTELVHTVLVCYKYQQSYQFFLYCWNVLCFQSVVTMLIQWMFTRAYRFGVGPFASISSYQFVICVHFIFCDYTHIMTCGKKNHCSCLSRIKLALRILSYFDILLHNKNNVYNDRRVQKVYNV